MMKQTARMNRAYPAFSTAPETANWPLSPVMGETALLHRCSRPWIHKKPDLAKTVPDGIARQYEGSVVSGGAPSPIMAM